jgi:hypothetical protein
LKKFYNEYLSINSGGRNNGMSFKYPYKPYLMVCIAKTMNVNSIKINDDFLLLFKNYLVKDPYMCEKYDDISEWSLKKIKG